MQAVKIGDYELLTPLEGGTHSLYKAKASEGQLVALKVIPLAAASDEQQERFLREAEIAKTLDHPNLLKLIASGSADGHLFQVMELLDGSDLRKVLSRKTAFTWEQRLQIMEQVCDGLGYAHSRGLVHRDLKPANLLLEESGRIRILDFGMARIQGSNLTRAGIALGTLNYMSPEQIRGEQCTAASDVFSCGIIFYELICGRHPFSFGSQGVEEILSSVLFQAPPSLRELVPDAPSAIENVINQALEKDPARRPQNASELRGMLRSCRVGLDVSAPAPPQRPAQNDLGVTRKLRRPDMDAVLAKMQAAPAEAPPPKRPVPVAPPPARSDTPKPASVYCPACAQANTKGLTTCAHCGASLMATTVSRIPIVQQRDKKTRWIIIGVIVAVVLTAVLLVIWRIRP